MKDASFKDFQKLDIRIGTVIEAEIPKWSHWVMKLTVDFGKEVGKKIAFAGIMKFFKPEDLVGKQFPFIVNLEPKKIGPKENGKQNISECMMLMAVPKDDEETPPVILSLDKKVPNGTRVH
ncbi:tRNA-binding protein [Candidatus Woesebacteria bacterium]|nr:MAG: tRNA-binding protein [Candidatus Woesebacteria bacterium]